MVRLLTAGAETLNAIADNKTMEGGITTSGTVTVDTGTVNTGSKSFKCDTGAGNAVAYVEKTFTGALATTYYARAWVNLSAAPGTEAPFIQFLQSTNEVAMVRVRTGGSTRLFWGGSNQGTSSVVITDGLWHCVEISLQINSGSADDSIELVVDGVSELSFTSQTIGTAALTAVRFGWPGATVPGANKVIYLDDLSLNDSTGSNQTSFAGVGREVLLLPISDNALGTGWTNDNLVNTTTNLWECVNNTPPIGIADTTSSTTSDQNRNATASANSNYDANLTTYTTAGIASGDTINVLDPIVATAAPVTTSAKQGTVGVSSNPVIANVALSATGTSGAFWAGATAGTYPTGWKASHGTATYAPSVTLNSSPVLRITQVTSSTRIAMVCFMGLYVDYTPAPAAGQVPYISSMPQLLAQ
jgi:hypothetical protein